MDSIRIQTIIIFFLKQRIKETWKEAERLANKEPVTPKQQIKPVNEIRKPSTLLDAFNY